jgi:hypothetical protein
MAYEFASASAKYLSATSAPVTAAPLSMACWFYPLNVTANMALVCLENSGGTDRFILQALGAIGGDPLQYSAGQATTSSAAANSTIGYSANQWSHACGVETNAASRIVYLNGGNSATNTTSRTPASIDRLKIGTLNFNGTFPFHLMNGYIAEVGIWNAALTAAEIASLANGMTCDKIRPQSLVFYAPLVRDLQDTKGGLTITNNNSATVATHPRVYA